MTTPHSLSPLTPSEGDGRDVGLNELARRQTAKSRFSHFAGTEADLTRIAGQCLPHAKPGSRDGVLRVPVPIMGFFAGVVTVTDRTPLAAAWVRRAAGEDPYITFSAPGAQKPPARAVELIVYRRDILLAGGRASTDRTWEIVSINARPLGDSLAEEPPHPVAMARNYLGRPGGTLTPYTVEQFTESVLYWGRRVHTGTEVEPLDGPEFPPLMAGYLKSDGGESWVDAWCADWTFLPPAAKPEPARPVTLARHWRKLVSQGKSLLIPVPNGDGFADEAKEFAESILYWSRRPRVLEIKADSGV